MLIDAGDKLSLAALPHDIGQTIPLKESDEVRMRLDNTTQNVGRIGHEIIGAGLLRAIGFSEKVCRLVGSHVAAKRRVILVRGGYRRTELIFQNRYLTAVDQSYHDSLSSASQKSLAFHGDPFHGAELEAFRGHPLRDQMVALRLWDDRAKVVGVESITPRAKTHLDVIERHLSTRQ
jgi:Predicted HD phosphohydrolase